MRPVLPARLSLQTMWLQFPLHSGRILGLPRRILISLMGLVVAMLSVTGVVIWWKKRAARVRQELRCAGQVLAYNPGPPANL